MYFRFCASLNCKTEVTLLPQFSFLCCTTSVIHSSKHMEASHHFELFGLAICFHIGPAAGPSASSPQTADQLTDTHGRPVWLLQSWTTVTGAAVRRAPRYWSWKHSIRHQEENKTSRYHFFDALLPSRKHRCASIGPVRIDGNVKKNKREDGDDVVEIGRC